MSDTIAAGQLRAFVERIERVEDRLEYALQQFDRCTGISIATVSRAFRLCAEVFATDYETAKYIIQSRSPTRIKPLNFTCAGFVYWASSDEAPGRVKIGFTRNMGDREVALSRLCGTPIKIRRFRAGTMLEEHATHCANRTHKLGGEWFTAEAA